jgi:hypothetical protein
MKTMTRLGELRITGHGEMTGHGEGAVVTHQPDGVYLQNDGVLRYWMQPNHTYTLTRDKIGWVVGCHSWPSDGHIYRLATAGAYTDRLPVGDEMVELDSAKRYELVPANGGWDLAEVA